jgi:hypothetical protein
MNVMHNTLRPLKAKIQAHVPHKSNENEVRFCGFRVLLPCITSPHNCPHHAIALTCTSPPPLKTKSKNSSSPQYHECHAQHLENLWKQKFKLVSHTNPMKTKWGFVGLGFCCLVSHPRQLPSPCKPWISPQLLPPCKSPWLAHLLLLLSKDQIQNFHFFVRPFSS